MLAAGSTVDEILGGYPFLEKEDIQAAVHFSELLMNRNVEQGFSNIKYFLNSVLSCGIVVPVSFFN